MIQTPRQTEIINILKEKKLISVNELAKILYVSPASIRRDLDKLENQDIVKRTYGHVTLVEGPHTEIPINIRETKYKDAKISIAKIAASLISDNDTIFLDSSSTALQICSQITKMENLTVITNGIRAINVLSEIHNVIAYCIPGKLRHHALSLVGSQAEAFTKNFYASKLFFSPTGLSLAHGAMDYSEAEAEVRKTMMTVCQEKIMLIDSSKFEHKAFYKICSLSDIDTIITNEEPSDEFKSVIAQNGVKLLYPTSTN